MEHTLLCQASYSGCDHQPIHLLLLSSSLMFECTVCLWMDIKKIILPFITIKDLVGIMLSEIKFDRKKKYCVISLIHESKKQKQKQKQKANKTSY